MLIYIIKSSEHINFRSKKSDIANSLIVFDIRNNHLHKNLQMGFYDYSMQ